MTHVIKHRGLLVMAALFLLTGFGCSQSEGLSEYRAKNKRCPWDLKVSCKVGPDGKLYRDDSE